MTATYYAIAIGDYIQMDKKSEHLEIYETREAANRHKRAGDEVVPVKVKRKKK